MGRRTRAWIAPWLALAGMICLAPLGVAHADPDARELAELKQQLEGLARENERMHRALESLEHEVQQARDQARAAEDMARARRPDPDAWEGGSDRWTRRQEAAILAQPLGGRARLQLLDVSLDVLAAAGASSATDDELALLQAGEHDPRQRGFTLQQTELSLVGAVDPYFMGEAHLIFFLDPEGESQLEIEEALARTQRLPFGLEAHGLQLEVGQFFTEFGRLNPRHPHAWQWLDQPVILSRLFGGDGIRQTGVRVGWLTPLPWFSELHLGVQNARGETMVSFLANQEVFEERPIGGRPFADMRVGSPADLVKLLRWVSGLDLSDTWSTQIGLSGLLGPNATGPDGRTVIFGVDWTAKWRPLRTDRGWPFVLAEAEFARRSYRADDFAGCPDSEGEPGVCADPLLLGDDTLRDWGFYAQILWGFRRGWAVGLRYEYATGDGESLGPYAGRDHDPLRADRRRLSPLLVWHPSEYSRFRLQYSYDRADHLEDENQHSIWAGIEFGFGAHPAHEY